MARRFSLLLASLLSALALGMTSCDEENPVGPQPPKTQGFSVSALFSKYANGQMTNLEQNLVRAIEGSTRTVLLDMPQLNSYAIVYSLREARHRGVHIELSLDASSPSEALRPLREDTYYDNRDPKEDKNEVTIRYRRETPTPSFQHRFAVIDGSRVWSGSYLATPSGNGEQDSDVVMVESQTLASQFTTAYYRMYGSGQNFAEIHREDGAELAVRFTPYEDAEALVADEIAKATQEIRFMSVALTSEKVAAALSAQADKGLSVQGVIESDNSAAEGSQYASLREKGLDITRDGNPYEMAHQVFIIDGQTVVTGSRGFNGGQGNLQQVLALRKQPDVAKAYLVEYARVRANSR